MATAALVLALGMTLARAGDEAPPKVSIVDGDTLQLGRQIFHLTGIDAPELGQRCMINGKEWRCGLDAALALKKLVAFGDVACTSDDNGAIIAGGCTAQGKDLAEVLLTQGYAVAAKNAFPIYRNAETAAKEAKLGLWRGKFVHPADWRNGERLPGELTDTTFCVVKAVITEQGQQLFYIPSDEEYAGLTIDPARGERMFCSDDAAILAGWHRFPRETP